MNQNILYIETIYDLLLIYISAHYNDSVGHSYYLIRISPTL